MSKVVPSCSCSECVEMCKRRPCAGTPKQIRRILLKYPEIVQNFTLDRLWYIGYNCNESNIDDVLDTDYLYAVSPNMKGNTESYMRQHQHGECIFLNNNLCDIHNIKPLEGRLAYHDTYGDNVFNKVKRSWRTKQGKRVIKLFLKMRGL